jgi:hypothetical protein
MIRRVSECAKNAPRLHSAFFRYNQWTNENYVCYFLINYSNVSITSFLHFNRTINPAPHPVYLASRQADLTPALQPDVVTPAPQPVLGVSTSL